MSDALLPGQSVIVKDIPGILPEYRGKKGSFQKYVFGMIVSIKFPDVQWNVNFLNTDVERVEE